MKGYLIKAGNYFRKHLFWKLFLALIVNLFLVIIIGFSSTQFFWEWRIKMRIQQLETSAVNEIVSFWQDKYSKNKSWQPFIKDEKSWVGGLDLMLNRPRGRDFYLMLEPNFLTSLALLDENKKIISSPVIKQETVDKKNDQIKYYFHKNKQLKILSNSNFYEDDDDYFSHKNNAMHGRKGINSYVHIPKIDGKFRNLEDDDHFNLTRIVFSTIEKDDLTLKEHPVIYENLVVGWVRMLGIKQNNRIVDQIMSNDWVRFLGGPLSIILITLMMAYLLSRWFLKPISKINKGLRALEKNDFSYRVKLIRKDELGQLASNFNQMATQMADFAARKKRWIATISHELRTPLTILQGEVEAMIDGIRKFEKKNLLSLKDELIELTKLTRDLQEIASYDNEQTGIVRSKIEVNYLLKEVIGKYKLLFSQKGLKIKLRTAPTKIWVLADEELLLRAIDKILENCSSHSSRGCVTIDSSVNGEFWQLIITDQGPGLPDDELPKIFEYFYTYNEIKSSGSGLGLAICRAIILLHKGTITAINSKTDGLAMTIKIKHY
ncbi:MAG: HAMP domain-containing protein [SAR324 cluster bacterium]|nr:HAMP domain-containing protein [SAR324 cluster bacterium]